MAKDEASRPFLTAEWRNLAMLNFEIDPAILTSLVPVGTELDEWQGRAYVSLVGFLFIDTRVMGIPIPFHRNFEEVNLRFYVRRKAADGWRRGVVFIREIVPRHAIALIANRLYNENYVALPMSHHIASAYDGAIASLRYSWTFRGGANFVEVAPEGEARDLVEGSEEQFIAEHYWGYAGQRDGGTVEYEVSHPPWRVRTCQDARFAGDAAAVYGPQFADALNNPPASAFLAEGSAIAVHRGREDRLMATEAAPQTGVKGWVLYDGSCGFCSRWVPRWQGVLSRRGFAIAPLQADWVAARWPLSPEELMSDIRLLLADGRHVRGAGVYRYLMRRIWWATPLYVLAILPGLSQVFDAAYRLFADNRHWISRTCHMPNQT